MTSTLNEEHFCIISFEGFPDVDHNSYKKMVSQSHEKEYNEEQLCRSKGLNKQVSS